MKRPESVEISVRPQKIALLVSDLDTVDRAIRYCSFIWGGKDNLLIPADQVTNKFWMNALQLYDPDYVVYPENSQEDLELPIQPLAYYKFNDLFDNGRTIYKCGTPLMTNVSPQKLAQPLHISEGKAQYLKVPPGEKLPLPLRTQLGGGPLSFLIRGLESVKKIALCDLSPQQSYGALRSH